MPKFAKKLTLNGTHISKISLKFTIFPQNFPKKAPYEGLIFVVWCFCNPTWDSWRSKKVPWPFLPEYPPPWIEALRGTNFFKDFGKLCEKIWPWMELKVENFLIFPLNFPGMIFIFWCFWDPTWDSCLRSEHHDPTWSGGGKNCPFSSTPFWKTWAETWNLMIISEILRHQKGSLQPVCNKFHFWKVLSGA